MIPSGRHVYVVTRCESGDLLMGVDSEYEIIAVYYSKEKAEEAAKRLLKAELEPRDKPGSLHYEVESAPLRP